MGRVVDSIMFPKMAKVCEYYLSSTVDCRTNQLKRTCFTYLAVACALSVTRSQPPLSRSEPHEKIIFVDLERQPSKLDAIDFDLTCMVTNEMYTSYLQILPVNFFSSCLVSIFLLVVKEVGGRW